LRNFIKLPEKVTHFCWSKHQNAIISIPCVDRNYFTENETEFWFLGEVENKYRGKPDYV
jgi:hypothetical protein